MKFFSYSNEKKTYTKAISLTDIRSIKTDVGTGKSAIRFSVCVTYLDGTCENFNWLTENEMPIVYNKLLTILNEDKGE